MHPTAQAARPAAGCSARPLYRKSAEQCLGRLCTGRQGRWSEDRARAAGRPRSEGGAATPAALKESGGFLEASLGGSGGLLGPPGGLLGGSWAPKLAPWSVSWPISSLLKLSLSLFTSKL